ncbi:MAG: hypothetical protein ACD_3C00213G0003 [uncultured bacterium (gcode 4)]|uniref:Archease domain-containing protein n=1 Tax=uncultured bacterium (gcode 4) TaxID=1234023 RepID=K2GB27_9BACT|nr:MAG: hypothetical protein ACD_3C00213G0003 [uncultured bacterium (gcode 4)]
MVTYEIIEHPSELRIRVYWKSIEEIFTNAGKVIWKILKTTPFPRTNKNIHLIKIKSSDMNNLLIDFLSEILTYSHINKSIYTKFNIKSIQETEITAEIFWYRVQWFDEDIKAVTYQDVNIMKTGRFYFVSDFVLDV